MDRLGLAKSTAPTHYNFDDPIPITEPARLHSADTKMAAVYKSLSKTNGHKAEAEAPSTGAKRNKQRVLILSSRGVTYR